MLFPNKNVPEKWQHTKMQISQTDQSIVMAHLFKQTLHILVGMFLNGETVPLLEENHCNILVDLAKMFAT